MMTRYPIILQHKNNEILKRLFKNILTERKEMGRSEAHIDAKPQTERDRVKAEGRW